MTALVLDGLRTLRRLIREAGIQAFQPPTQMTISQWADDFRQLPKTSAEPGQFRTDRIPYMRRIQDVLSDDITKEVVFAKSSQTAGSTVAENFIGFTIDQDPSGIISVWPTEKKLEKWSLTRLEPLLQETPCLAARFPKTGRRDAGNSMSTKIFPAGYLIVITAKSASDLKSDSARRAIAEELDEWEVDLKNQGDPLELLRVRLRTFWNSKLFIVSTPTIADASRIWDELSRSSWEEYWVACPHCHEYQTLRWRDGNEDLDQAGSYRLIWEKDAEGMLIPGTTRYVCVNGCEIEERWKTWMIDDRQAQLPAQWRGRFPHRPTKGFHINTIYSPLCQWDDIVKAFERADTDEKKKAFVNTWLGLPYRGKGETISSHFLSQRAEIYPSTGSGDDAIEVIPAGVGVLTASVDVQGDRIELFIWGWGADSERWVISWEQIEGDPGKAEVWKELERKRMLPRRHESGATLTIAAMCVDAGYQTDMVHSYCNAHQVADRVIAVVGRSGSGKKLLSPPDPKKFKRAGNRRPTHVVGTDSGKALLASALRVKEPGPNYVHFPASIDAIFYEQLTAERLVARYKSGRPVRAWELIAGRRNEALDGAVYAEAALLQLGPNIRKQLKAIVVQVQEAGAAAAGAAIPTTAPRAGRRTLSQGLGT